MSASIKKIRISYKLQKYRNIEKLKGYKQILRRQQKDFAAALSIDPIADLSQELSALKSKYDTLTMPSQLDYQKSSSNQRVSQLLDGTSSVKALLNRCLNNALASFESSQKANLQPSNSNSSTLNLDNFKW